MTSLTEVDWSRLPKPVDDGTTRHMQGACVPNIELLATNGELVALSRLKGRTVVFAYPLTGRPDRSLPDGWNDIPGARGCTPQACAFRDLASAIMSAGVDFIFGMSTQDTAYQLEAVERLHLPFPLISDSALEFARSMELPTFTIGGIELLKRLTLVIDDGVITKVFYPIFPPDKNAADVLMWLSDHAR